MDKMDGRSLDILEENIEKMKQLFPEVFTEGKVDVEKLAQVLGEYAEDEDERYDFTWNGKKDAIRISQTPTTGTLRPDKENSKNWDETENVYIEGDNLEVLKLLQKSYHSKVKMIYIDPPYNTGKDFVYKDNYRDNMKNYLEYTGQVDSEGKKTSTNAETSGRYHTDWLNMMYPRLRLARNLLTDDGVIFISIDDNEVHNLRKVCDEIFGEGNFISSLVWKTKFGGGNDSKYIVNESEYILVYGKNKNKIIGFRGQTNYTKYEYEDKYLNKRGRYSLESLYRSSIRYSESLYYGITAPDGSIVYPNDSNPESDRHIWRWSKSTFEQKKKEGRVKFKKTSRGWRVYSKQYELLTDDNKPRITPFRQNIMDIPGRRGTELLSKLMGYNISFDNPKPLDLIKLIINTSITKDSIILDFFAGSSTTAHAVMDLNTEDEGSRKFIMVQLPEETDEKSEAFKEGYKTISDIGRERIRRAGEKIKEDNKDKEGIDDLDIGFKSFKLDSSNIKEWNPEYEDKDFDFESLVNNFVEDRNEEDILYEIILKYGIDLTVPMKEHSVDEKTIYDIGFGTLYICLDNNIDENIIGKIVELNKESGMERARVVFKDTGFKDDETKLNAKLTLENNGIEEVLSI